MVSVPLGKCFDQDTDGAVNRCPDCLGGRSRCDALLAFTLRAVRVSPWNLIPSRRGALSRAGGSSLTVHANSGNRRCSCLRLILFIEHRVNPLSLRPFAYGDPPDGIRHSGRRNSRPWPHECWFAGARPVRAPNDFNVAGLASRLLYPLYGCAWLVLHCLIALIVMLHDQHPKMRANVRQLGGSRFRLKTTAACV